MINDIHGKYQVLFLGQEKYVEIEITGIIQDSRGAAILLLGPDETVYNWANIVIMRRAK